MPRKQPRQSNFLAEALAEKLDHIGDIYRTSPAVRAAIDCSFLLVLLLSIDGLLGFQPGLRMIYIVPTWLSVKRGGRAPGTLLVALTSISLALIDATNAKIAPGAFMTNGALQVVVLYSLMRIFDAVEVRLRDVTTRATRDPLTGIYNRSALEEHAAKAIDHATVTDEALIIGMVDCDRFKEMNDKWGHAFGDMVLKQLARTFRRGLQGVGFIGRNGGDEFIVVITGKSKKEATAIMESIYDRFTSFPEIVTKNGGFSYGLAELRKDGLDYSKLVLAADKDMYRRKGLRSAAVQMLA